MPNFNDYNAFKSTSSGNGSSSGKKGGGFGLGWVVIIVVTIMFVSFILDGASWDAIDSLLGLGFIAFLFVRSL